MIATSPDSTAAQVIMVQESARANELGSTPILGVSTYPAEFFADRQPTTARDLIDLLPGFVFDPGTQLRGLAGSATNVLINGAQPVVKTDSLDQLLRRMPARSVERIDVIRGGAPGIDMLGKTIVANIILKQEVGGRFDVTAAVVRSDRSDTGWFTQLHGQQPIGASKLEFSLLKGHYLDDTAGNGAWTRRSNDGRQLLDASQSIDRSEDVLKITGSLDSPVFGGELKLNFALRDGDYDGRLVARIPAVQGSESDSTVRESFWSEGSFSYRRPVAKYWKLEVSGLHLVRRVDLQNTFTATPGAVQVTGDSSSADFRLQTRATESVARAQISGELTTQLSLEAGIEGAINRLTTDTRFVNQGQVVALRAGNVTVEEVRGEGILELTAKLNSKLILEGGVRVELSTLTSGGQVNSSRSLTFIKPRALLSWSPNSVNRVRLLLERFVGQLNFSDFTAQAASINTGTIRVGNPMLSPQQDWILEAGWERSIGEKGSASLTLRHRRLNAVLDRVPVFTATSALDSPGNIGKGTLNEAIASWTLPTDDLGLARGLFRSSLSLRRSRVTDPVTGTERSISNSPSYEWSMSFTQPLTRLKSELGFNLARNADRASYFVDEINYTRQGTYFGAYWQYKPFGSMAIRLDLLNILAQELSNRRDIYTDVRAKSPFLFVEERWTMTPRFARLRVTYEF